MSKIKNSLPEQLEEPQESLPPDYQAALDRVSVMNEAFNRIFGKREDAPLPF